MHQESLVDKFESLLKSHDWTYDSSDDYYVWKKGDEEWKIILHYRQECIKMGYGSVVLDDMILKYSKEAGCY